MAKWGQLLSDLALMARSCVHVPGPQFSAVAHKVSEARRSLSHSSPQSCQCFQLKESLMRWLEHCGSVTESGIAGHVLLVNPSGSRFRCFEPEREKDQSHFLTTLMSKVGNW